MLFRSIMIPIWSFNERKPVFVTKDNLFNDVYMTLGQATWASASTPYYFKPAEINGKFYISGDNVAVAPALFATLYLEKKGTHLKVLVSLTWDRSFPFQKKLNNIQDYLSGP